MHTCISHSQKANSKGAEPPPQFQKWGGSIPLPPSSLQLINKRIFRQTMFIVYYR